MPAAALIAGGRLAAEDIVPLLEDDLHSAVKLAALAARLSASSALARDNAISIARAAIERLNMFDEEGLEATALIASRGTKDVGTVLMSGIDAKLRVRNLDAEAVPLLRAVAAAANALQLTDTAARWERTADQLLRFSTPAAAWANDGRVVARRLIEGGMACRRADIESALRDLTDAEYMAACALLWPEVMEQCDNALAARLVLDAPHRARRLPLAQHLAAERTIARQLAALGIEHLHTRLRSAREQEEPAWIEAIIALELAAAGRTDEATTAMINSLQMGGDQDDETQRILLDCVQPLLGTIAEAPAAAVADAAVRFLGSSRPRVELLGEAAAWLVQAGYHQAGLDKAAEALSLVTRLAVDEEATLGLTGSVVGALADGGLRNEAIALVEGFISLLGARRGHLRSADAITRGLLALDKEGGDRGLLAALVAVGRLGDEALIESALGTVVAWQVRPPSSATGALMLLAVGRARDMDARAQQLAIVIPALTRVQINRVLGELSRFDRIGRTAILVEIAHVCGERSYGLELSNLARRTHYGGVDESAWRARAAVAEAATGLGDISQRLVHSHERWASQPYAAGTGTTPRAWLLVARAFRAAENPHIARVCAEFATRGDDPVVTVEAHLFLGDDQRALSAAQQLPVGSSLRTAAFELVLRQLASASLFDAAGVVLEAASTYHPNRWLSPAICAIVAANLTRPGSADRAAVLVEQIFSHRDECGASLVAALDASEPGSAPALLEAILADLRSISSDRERGLILASCARAAHRAGLHDNASEFAYDALVSARNVESRTAAHVIAGVIPVIGALHGAAEVLSIHQELVKNYTFWREFQLLDQARPAFAAALDGRQQSTTHVEGVLHP
jgi:hypothetical protein